MHEILSNEHTFTIVNGSNHDPPAAHTLACPLIIHPPSLLSNSTMPTLISLTLSSLTTITMYTVLAFTPNIYNEIITCHYANGLMYYINL